jgi:hypothetical protein
LHGCDSDADDGDDRQLSSDKRAKRFIERRPRLELSLQDQKHNGYRPSCYQGSIAEDQLADTGKPVQADMHLG